MRVIPLYASLLAFLFVFLSARTIRMRRKAKVAVGDAGNAELARAIGVHANFAEYTPFALILLFALESFRAPHWALHLWGVAFCAGRISHAYGVSQLEENFRFRVFGMVMTFFTLTTAAAALLFFNYR